MSGLDQHYGIIKRTLFTEKGTTQQEYNTFTFVVHPKANKVQIRQAVEAIFKVKVTKVRTMNQNGKYRRFGASAGKTSDWKKALVTLREGDSIHQV